MSFIPKNLQVTIKYLIEWIFCFFAFIALLPLFIIIAALVKVTSKGPLFYITEKTGRNKKSFKQLKFRSMYDNVPPKLTDDFRYIVFKNDNRVTPIGRFLRIGIDELPQLWNVLKREMTLIGPRPNNAWFTKYYNEYVSQRLNMLPGITSLAAVCNGRKLSDAENHMIDIFYVNNYSILLDIKIFIMTILYISGKKNVGDKMYKKIFSIYGNQIDNFKITKKP